MTMIFSEDIFAQDADRNVLEHGTNFLSSWKMCACSSVNYLRHQNKANAIHWIQQKYNPFPIAGI